jgi:chemotaxis protein methyltransferase CheR
MMRNVLIYFDVETKRDILDRARRVLAPDGYLMLGAAETTMNVHEGYAREVVAGASCYRPV